MNNLATENDIGKLVREYALPAAFMTTAGFADSLQTYQGIQKHGLEYLADIEWNPLLRLLASSVGAEGSLFLPKIVMSTFALGLSVVLAQRGTDQGKYLMIGAGMWWGFGFVSNYILYYSSIGIR